MRVDELQHELDLAERYAEDTHHKAKGLERENAILRQNVYDLQEQLNASHTRIKELLAKIPETEEELIRKVMIARGVNPDDKDEIITFWSDYHGIED